MATVIDRRKFLTLGGLISIAPVAAVSSAVDENGQDPLPRVENGQVLTAELINAMIDRINNTHKS
ncbi:MAG: hypothetical protein ACO3CH_00390 [Ilumatobacteraceae bacterium]|nr:hypothetical protein [Chitinophagales bacterium]